MNELHSPTPRLIGTIDGPVGRMVFNNPERRNALSLDMWQAIPVLLDQFEAEPALRVLVLEGAGGKAFIAGADISEFESARAAPAAIQQYDEIAERAMSRLQNSALPTIAAIRGFCIGGGVGVSLVCDLRLAAESARFAIPAARLGLGYRWGGVKKLADLVGPAFAKEIFFTARQFSAAEAQSMGLINRAVPEPEFDTLVASYCAMIAENAPLTVQAVKGVVTELGKPGAEIDRARAEALVARCFASEDYVEGRRAFMEKRKPVFRGK
ncbi:MAG TPA: enoyl-CoA hydratase [Stellaceae bacterium]|nr:enoyl-CoA hydratase [Stellaceae bacterium]